MTQNFIVQYSGGDWRPGKNHHRSAASCQGAAWSARQPEKQDKDSGGKGNNNPTGQTFALSINTHEVY